MATMAELINDDLLWNPYDFANPVSDEALFAGRSDEVAEIQYYLRQAARAPRPINLVLTGARSSGKTSLLNKIEQLASERGMVVARVDLNESDTDPLAFFYKVYDSILLAAVTVGAFSGPQGSVYRDYRKVIDAGLPADTELLFPTHYSAAVKGSRVLSEPTLKADLKTIAQEVAKPCVILFDECDVLAKSRIELEMLRNIFMNTAGYMLVFAGTPGLFPVMEEVFSPIIRQFKKVTVSRFSDSGDTIECIRKPLRSLGVNPDEIMPANMYLFYSDVERLSGGRPYEIQLLCHFMFRRIEERRAEKMSITVDVLDDVRHELETQESGSGRRSIVEMKRLTKPNLEDFRHLTQFRGTVHELWLYAQLFEQYSEPEDHLLKAAQRYMEAGLLSIEDSLVSFRGDQFDEVYARYIAASRDVAMYIVPWSLQEDMTFRLRMQLGTLDEVEIVSARTEESNETRLKLEESLAALARDASAPESLPDFVTDQIYELVNRLDETSLTLGLVTLSLEGQSASVWVALTGSATEESISSDQSLIDLAARARRLGGDLEVTFYTYPLPERAAVRENALRLASVAQREELAEVHRRISYSLYEEGLFLEAAAEAEWASQVAGGAAAATMAAHLNMLAGRPEVALAFAVRARDLTVSGDDAEQWSIAAFDYAVLSLILDNIDEARQVLKATVETSDRISTKPAMLILPKREESGVWVIDGDRKVSPREAIGTLLRALE
jgi:hypothetical protein